VVFGEKKHDKEERTIAKNVNFGTFYGLFPRGLQTTLKFKAGVEKTLQECETIIANLKNGYPRLSEWQKETVKQAQSDRFTETWLGRRRYLPNITSTDWGKKSFAERCALNTPIQVRSCRWRNQNAGGRHPEIGSRTDYSRLNQKR
jgi:DNA polymerase-1